MGKSFIQRLSLALVFAVCFGGSMASAQMPPGNPIEYPKMLSISITNPADLGRTAEPVIIPLVDILQKAPDFNRDFFRVKRPSNEGFEPLDIPSQIRIIPGTGYSEELVFLVDLKPRERKVIELQYNPAGKNMPEYPNRTAAFEKWYTGGVNIAWENEECAYRSYSGLIDYFGKSYPHLRLHNLPPDSYHHEATWGVDPFIIGKKPGLCGVSLVEGAALIPCYGSRDSVKFTHRAFGGGPVCAGAVIQCLDGGKMTLEESYTLFAGHHENYVRTVTAKKTVQAAIGIQKMDGESVNIDEKQGFAVTQAKTGEYGAIGMVLVFDPADYVGQMDRTDGHFITLKPSRDGTIRYLSMEVWYRVSAEQPKNMDTLVKRAQYLAQCFRNPPLVEISR